MAKKIIENKTRIDSMKDFIVESKDELKKVSWPNKTQIKNSTRVVVIISILSGIYIGLADMLFKYLYDYIVLK